MNNATELHAAAMDRAELAMLARLGHEYDQARLLFGEALQLELRALNALKTMNAEPTRSILRRSAATLALDCGEPLVAEKLIAQGLADGAPASIADELRDLMEQVNFRRHLQLREIALADDEFQLSLAGQGVGLGVVSSDEFLQRVGDTSRMFYRIGERRRGLPFRETGRMKKAVADDLELYVSVPRAASFAVTLKVGRPSIQGRFAAFVDTSAIVDEFLELMALINNADYKKIREKIPDEAYRTNFLQLAKRLAPDGDKIRMVGFTSYRLGGERFVEVTRPKAQVASADPTAAPTKTARVTVRGTLKFADDTRGESSEIKIVEHETGAKHRVKVPKGMMSDIVKPMWDSEVVIRGEVEGKVIVLEEIDQL